jgi:uncharacterized protein
MLLRNAFSIDVPADLVWTSLRDLEATAQCFPGATVTKIDDEHYDGTVQVRLGPMVVGYRAAITMVDWDDAARQAVMTAEARETRGQGSASARMAMTVAGDEAAQVEIESDLQITGRVAQLGGGAMQDVAEQLVAEFATNLHTQLAGASQEVAPRPGVAPPTARPINGFGLVVRTLWRRIRALFSGRSSS